ncbi:hypothetical protein NRB56_76410 [Nocardia sp. RB56]|uniref:Uncharacterized protein n=1 Tax=Nocardia aurantia TaxID=2585199 RepID=A0A7K0E2U0_9NOCA|nr:hypothetical protein [Nocardia aurantia]
MIGIQRHIRTTGRRHRIHPHDQIQRTPHPQRHQRFRPHILPDQPPRQPPHPPRELGIGQTRPLERDRERLRTPRHLRLEQRHQGRGGVVGHRRQRRVQREFGVVPLLQHERVFELVEQRQIADAFGRIGGDRVQYAQESLGEDGRVVVVEKICGVGEFGRHPDAVGLAQRQLQIELGGRLVEVEGGDRETRQFQGGAAEVLERQHHLEQRMPRLRPGRVEHLHQPLERHVRVRERLEVVLAHLREQFGETGAGIDPGAQHQGVDEHADEVVEGAVTAARDGDADRDVVGAGQSRQQSGESAVHHHEQRGAVRVPDPVERFDQVGGDLEPVGPGVISGDGGPRPGGQPQLVRQSGQRVLPVGQLLRDQRAPVILGSEDIPLPQCVIRVLHGQRRPARFGAGAAGDVRGHQIPHQRRHRETVGGDVVHDHDQYVFGRVEPVQPQPGRGLLGDIETAAGEFVERRQQFGTGEFDDVRLRDGTAGRQHLLVGDPVVRRVDRAQRLVPGHHVGDRGAQRGEIQSAGEPYRCRNVVGGRGGRAARPYGGRAVRPCRGRPRRGGIAEIGVEAVEEPHPLLRQRQRRVLRSRTRREHLPRDGALVRFDPGGQSGRRGRLEHGPDTDLGAQRGRQPRDQLRCDQRVSAELEEVVVDAHPCGAEQFREDARDDLLDRRGRRAVSAHGEHRRRQRLPVELAGGVQRELVEDDDPGRNHVGRK